MGRGRRYNQKPKLNYKKVFAVIVAIIVFIMFICMVKKILINNDSGKIRSEAYFTVFSDNKWGIINSKGDIVIEPSYREILIVPNSKKDIFLCTYEIDEQTGMYKTKVLNSNNEEIFTEYELVEALENYDKNNNVWYEENILKVQKNGKKGLIDLKGNVLLDIIYDDIYTMKGIKNSIIIKKDEKVGLVDNTGNQIIECKYYDIKNLGTDYKEGYITITDDKKYGIITYTKKQILENKYEEIIQLYGTNIFVIKESGKQKVINKEGKILLEEGFDEIVQILEYSDNNLIFVKEKKYGVISVDGEIIIQPQYEDLKGVKDNTFIAKKNNKYGIIDNYQAEKLPFNYEIITYNKDADLYIGDNEQYISNIIDTNFDIKLTGILSEINTDKGYLKIRIDNQYKYYNFRFEEKNNTEIFPTNTLFINKKDGKYGFVDKNNVVVVDYIYDDVTEQNEYGYAAVKKDGLWGCVDSTGNEIISPKYNLDDNFVINFIGKWHLGQDINMNYYCEK